MAANDVAALVTDAMPYVTAAAAAYGGTVLFLAVLKMAMRKALEWDAVMLAEVRGMLSEVPAAAVRAPGRCPPGTVSFTT